MLKLLAITNSAAGSSTEAVIEEVLHALRESWDVAVVGTADDDELRAALSEHSDVDVVAALGGDGTLHAVVAALYAMGRLPGTAVTVIPLGTGNDFARSLALPEDPTQAAVTVAAGEIRPVDLIIDGTDQVVVNAAHVGLGAEAAAKARPYKKLLGPVGYGIGAIISGLTTPGSQVKISIDGKELKPHGKVAQVAVGNGRYVGGGAALLPHSEIDDGLIDVAISYASSPTRRLVYAWKLMRGTHADAKFVDYRRGAYITVSGEALRCTSDGELTERLAEHHWVIQPGGMRMLLPTAADNDPRT